MENQLSFVPLLQTDHLVAYLSPDTRLTEPSSAIGDVFEAWVLRNHFFNCRLWREEDLARRTDVIDSDIVHNKRQIDRFNQQRNDAVEHMDDLLLRALSSIKASEEPGPQPRLSSETAGAIIDRLSILALKIHHMKLESERITADAMHRSQCAEKTERLIGQREDLIHCLHELWSDCLHARAYFKIYRQFKMYNDPSYQKASHFRRNQAKADDANRVSAP